MKHSKKEQVTIRSELDWFRKQVAEAIQVLRGTRLTYEQSREVTKIYKATVDLVNEIKKNPNIDQ